MIKILLKISIFSIHAYFTDVKVLFIIGSEYIVTKTLHTQFYRVCTKFFGIVADSGRHGIAEAAENTEDAEKIPTISSLAYMMFILSNKL